MKRESVLKSISEEYKLSADNTKLLAEFLKENSSLEEHAFYEKLKMTFPWLEYSIKYEDSRRLRSINNHLYFFKVITIISIILGLIVALILTK